MLSVNFVFMQLPLYIDIHKHTAAEPEQAETLRVYNRHDLFSDLPNENLYSIGLHPWYIKESEVNNQLALLRQAAENTNVIAIGECGLDAIKGAPFNLQQEVFEKEIAIANEIEKPLLIHCVRAFPQALALLKKAAVPVIFHGFNKKAVIANEIIAQGYYLSFGADLLKEISAAFNTFSAVPIDRFFLETDDKPIDIEQIYKAASFIRKTGEDVIILQVQENFKKVFNL